MSTEPHLYYSPLLAFYIIFFGVIYLSVLESNPGLIWFEAIHLLDLLSATSTIYFDTFKILLLLYVKNE